jgi:hypothetical protein
LKKKLKQPETYFFKKVVPIPIYGGKFLIVFSNDTVKVARIVNTHPDNIGHIYGLTFHNFLSGGWESFCVCFNFWTPDPITLGTICHEVNHAANRLMQSREFEPDWKNDEAECYLKGWMADEIQKFMVQCNIT